MRFEAEQFETHLPGRANSIFDVLPGLKTFAETIFRASALLLF